MGLKIIDVNTWLGSWPFQYFHDDTAELLAAHLESEGINSAFVGSPETAFHVDCAPANNKLLEKIAHHSSLWPVVTINPEIGGWTDALLAFRDQGVVAVRLLPGYHGYTATSPSAIQFVDDAARMGGFLLFVQLRIEDERTHHPLCKIPAADYAVVCDLAARYPEIPFIVLCAYMHEAIELVEKTPNVYFDLSYVETMRTLPSLLTKVPADRVLFGSHSPFLYTRSALMKLEAPGVDENAGGSVASGNITRLLDSVA